MNILDFLQNTGGPKFDFFLVLFSAHTPPSFMSYQTRTKEDKFPGVSEETNGIVWRALHLTCFRLLGGQGVGKKFY